MQVAKNSWWDWERFKARMNYSPMDEKEPAFWIYIDDGSIKHGEDTSTTAIETLIRTVGMSKGKVVDGCWVSTVRKEDTAKELVCSALSGNLPREHHNVLSFRASGELTC